jgi:hypothetical protein
MPNDTISTDRLVTCPCCGVPMRFARTVPKVGDLPEMQTFECRLCHLAVTAEQVRGYGNGVAVGFLVPCLSGLHEIT